MAQTAFGTAFGKAILPGKPDIYNSVYITLQVFDDSRAGAKIPDYILWPNKSAFPNDADFMSPKIPWSIQLNTSVYEEPDINSVSVTLTRISDGKAWTFTKEHNTYSDSGRYFNVDSSGCGGWDIKSCIIFRPEGATKYEGEYKVSVTGLKKADGSDAALDYTVSFFNLFHDLKPTPTPIPTPTQPGSGSGGGCDAGFGVIALLTTAAAGLGERARKQNKKSRAAFWSDLQSWWHVVQRHYK